MQRCCVPSGWLDVDASEGRLVFFAVTHLETAGIMLAVFHSYTARSVCGFVGYLRIVSPPIGLARFPARASMSYLAGDPLINI